MSFQNKLKANLNNDAGATHNVCIECQNWVNEVAQSEFSLTQIANKCLEPEVLTPKYNILTEYNYTSEVPLQQIFPASDFTT